MSDAVLLSFHGTVSSEDELPAFLARIRRGRPAPPELLEEVRRRYRHIGGSPLLETTREQGRLLSARLGLDVEVAGRLWDPSPRQALEALAARGARRVLSLPLAPQSTAVYHAAVREALGELPLTLVEAPGWGTEPALVDACVETIREGLARFPAEDRWATTVVLTAHSLPKRVIDAGDPYERDFRAMAEAVGERVRALGHAVTIAFQSQGLDGGAWLGPDLPTAFRELARWGAKNLLVAPIGFVAEHMETLYDLDVEAPVLAREAGVAELHRAPALGTRARFIDALEAVARRALREGGGGAP